jgi:hypothetical protein
MSYTIKPSDANTLDRATNFAAIVRAASGVVLSRGGVRPCRKVGREGSLREASNEDMLRASETPLRWQKHGCDVLFYSSSLA